MKQLAQIIEDLENVLQQDDVETAVVNLVEEYIARFEEMESHMWPKYEVINGTD